MKLNKRQLRALVESEFGVTAEASEDDMHNAQNAEYGLDMLHHHFSHNPADEAARQRVMEILWKIQES